MAAVGFGEDIGFKKGPLRQLIPDYLEVGINMVTPCEVAAGMSCPELRMEFGRELRLMGGIDKREIAKGRKAIDAEIEHFLDAIRKAIHIA